MIRYLEAIETLPPEIKLSLIKAFELFKEEIAETVKRSDFEELKAVVRELAEAQKRTEQRVEELAEAQKRTEERLTRLEGVVEELAEAQKRTEQRVEELAEAQKRTEQRVEELAEAQKRTEERLTRLEGVVEELAEAQKRTEQRVEELAEAQKRTEERLNELAEAQKRTEEELRTLIKGQKEIRQELGRLSHTVGYRLEDEAFKALPELLRQEMGLEIKGRLKRDFVEIGEDRYIEVNIIGEGTLNGRVYLIVGEAKTQLKKRDIDEFIKRADEIKRYIPKEQMRVLVTYHASPPVLRYAKDKGIKVFFSYEF
jgi:chromosome segregation ATPase